MAHRLTGCATSVMSRTTMPDPPRSVTSASFAPDGIFEAHVTVARGGNASPLGLGLGNANGVLAGWCAVGVGCPLDVVLPHAATITGTTMTARPLRNA